MCGVDQRLQVGFGAEGGIDRLVVEHVVAVVRGRGVDRREPDGRDAQCVEVVEPSGESLQVAFRVSVSVGETVDERLVGDVGTLDVIPGIGFGHDLFAAGRRVARLFYGDRHRFASRGRDGQRCRAFGAVVGRCQDVERRGGPARSSFGGTPFGPVVWGQRPRTGVGAQVDQLASSFGPELDLVGCHGEQRASVAGGLVLAARECRCQEKRQQQVEQFFHHR